ncbi:Gp19/Gp15/Gp42 family protein [Demequina globuliformis]|uniref:Gp19/Gp15/Gp42 family protein n=1 Tax=Demequina globuliformis TaxID=676202 RepID=UPI000781BCD7|nr:Gp19/Gp15/Gp42 family protein [Demequina globuliformis]
MTYAVLTDVSTRLGRAISDADEVAQVEAWLSDVEAIIRARVPDLDDRVTDGNPAEAVVVMVEANAVVRKVKNPDGKQNERIDDYSYGLNSDYARGDLFLTDDEWELLLPSSGSQDAFSIHPRGMRDLSGKWSPPNYSTSAGA